ncbi:endo-1,4-beta-xylanase [Bacteroides rodentium]|uniref:endo-1,4-beta-xylanase n=1 Tax=Bacteroides rodentium TaxID=691816 RepID=UPI0004707E63|nr:endo-1,4-beta-xylanase [Bacteroides rodentium]
MKFKNIVCSVATVAWLSACGGGKQAATEETTLKEAFGNKFLIGVAINARQASGQDSIGASIAKRHFNSIVAEDCMKSANIHPEEDCYDFKQADEFVKFGEENGMAIIGHCLIWHSQCAPWFFTDKEGKQVSAEVLKQRMKDHITTVMSRYKGKVKGWDVVNEAIEGDGSWRQTKFYEILGEEYIPLAFQYAHEADPDAELYYNDYGMHAPGRRNGVVRLVKSLKEKGLRIDAVGLQGHMGMDYPSVEDFEKSMMAFAACDVKLMITEWEMSALPTVHERANISDTVAFHAAMNPYPEVLPDSVSRVWNARMKAFFNLFVKHSDVMERVTVWGVSDGDSWKNDFPVKGRKEYPLLFDRNYEMKPFLKELMEDSRLTSKQDNK